MNPLKHRKTGRQCTEITGDTPASVRGVLPPSSYAGRGKHKRLIEEFGMDYDEVSILMHWW